MFYRTSTAITMLILALGAWSLVGYFAMQISSDETDRLATIEARQLAAMKDAASMRSHVLALDTARERTQLKELLDVDIVSAAYQLEEVGKIAGVAVHLGDAQPEALASVEGLPVRGVGFLVEADGKFSALMRAAQLFENLPLPSRVTRLDLEHAPRSGAKPGELWHMKLQIRILTTSDISS